MTKFKIIQKVITFFSSQENYKASSICLRLFQINGSFEHSILGLTRLNEIYTGENNMQNVPSDFCKF